MANKEFILSIFDKIDDDKSGEISQDELVSAFKAFDTDGDGCVSKSEFCPQFKAKFCSTAEQAEKLFGKLDKDGDGNLDVHELATFFKDMDKDGDGNVSRDEFTAFWSKIMSS